MQKFRIYAAKHDSCMQYIGVLSVVPIDKLEIRVRTWITRFDSKMWNIYDISERDISLRMSTQNHFGFIAGIHMDEFDYTTQARNICNDSRVE
ncbi:hypothetical protein MXB_4368, partial [Myxobolus squamalis]